MGPSPLCDRQSHCVSLIFSVQRACKSGYEWIFLQKTKKKQLVPLFEIGRSHLDVAPQELCGDHVMKLWVGEIPFLGELSLSKKLLYTENGTLSLKFKLSHTGTQRHYLRLLMKP